MDYRQTFVVAGQKKLDADNKNYDSGYPASKKSIFPQVGHIYLEIISVISGKTI